jgi:hypothetical protein
MYIDCDSRNVFWREKSQDDNTESELEEPSPFVPRMTRAIYDDGDCQSLCYMFVKTPTLNKTFILYTLYTTLSVLLFRCVEFPMSKNLYI